RARCSFPCASTANVSASRERPVTGPQNTGTSTQSSNPSHVYDKTTRIMLFKNSAPSDGSLFPNPICPVGSYSDNEHPRVVSESVVTLTDPSISWSDTSAMRL